MQTQCDCNRKNKNKHEFGDFIQQTARKMCTIYKSVDFPYFLAEEFCFIYLTSAN